MMYNKTVKSDNVCFNMKGRFVFSDHMQFKDILDYIENDAVGAVRLDFKEVEFIDSAALGLLLLAKEKSEKAGKRFVLERPVGQVAKMFKISRFQDMFDIVEDGSANAR
ncbi:MAG: STAS domain-containing protein [Rickettsiales bacterium]